MQTGYPETQQPMMGDHGSSTPPQEWTTGLCGCTEDCGNCCITWCCPCITFGQISEVVDGTPNCGVNGAIYTLIMCFLGCPCFFSCGYRSKLRAKFDLPPSPCGDCVLHCFCESCALCQEYRELKNRGMNPSHGIVAFQQQQQNIQMAYPPAPQTMHRK